MRRLFRLRPAPEFMAWLQSRGIFRGEEPANLDGVARRELMGTAEKLLGGT
jgi:ethanolamine ammonia-lyase large subunit